MLSGKEWLWRESQYLHTVAYRYRPPLSPVCHPYIVQALFVMLPVVSAEIRQCWESSRPESVLVIYGPLAYLYFIVQ